MNTTMKLNSVLTSSFKYLTLILGAFAALVPLWVILLISFKTNDEIANFGEFSLPQNWLNVSNYVVAFTKGNMGVGLVNTTIILAASLIATILLGSMTAYVLSRFEFRFKKLVIFLFLLASLVPGVTTQVATFQVVN